MNRDMYYITLPNGKEIILWFIGPQLKQVLEAYNIPYKITKTETYGRMNGKSTLAKLKEENK